MSILQIDLIINLSSGLFWKLIVPCQFETKEVEFLQS